MNYLSVSYFKSYDILIKFNFVYVCVGLKSFFKMPKKFVGMNSKAVEAKARRDAIKQEADAKKQKAIDDELWKDDDKNAVKKQKRKVSFIVHLMKGFLIMWGRLKIFSKLM